MTETALRSKSIEALKAFNNAIVMSKLYPPEAPQLANAIDRGYKIIKQFIRDFGPLVFSHKEEQLFVCGLPLQEETLESFANLVVYRQLRALEMAKLVIRRDMDRFAFSQLLALFNASVAKIKKEGGGAAYITSLGLASFFAEQNVEQAVVKTSEAPSQHKIIKVKTEFVDVLLNRQTDATLRDEVVVEMNGAGGAALLVAGTGVVLKEISAVRKVMAHPLFATMLGNADNIVEEGKKAAVASEFAQVITQNLKSQALMVLVCQSFSGSFGGFVFNSILRGMPLETFGKVVELLRHRVDKTPEEEKTSEQFLLVKETLERLQTSPKGRQYAGAETAKQLLEKGEKDRRKKRLEAGLQSLLQGNTSVLQSDEFLEYLPKAVRKMMTENAAELVDAVATRLAKSFSEMAPADEKTAKSLVETGRQLIDRGYWEPLSKIAMALVKYVRSQKVITPALENCLDFLQVAMQQCWLHKRYEAGDSIVLLFHNIRSGVWKKSPEFTTTVGQIQDKGIQRVLLPELLEACLASPADDTPGYRLIYQGPVAIRFLVDVLMSADKEEERYKILDMLTSGSSFVASIVLERLPELMPWYGKRNLLKLLGETGREADAESVLPFLGHEDYRVQLEALMCMYKIGGKQRKKLLLTALSEATEGIKIKIIKLLGTMADQDVAASLGDMLVHSFEVSEKNRNEYVTMILETLGRSVCPASLKSVEQFLDDKGSKNTRKISDQVWTLAEKIQKFLAADLQELRRKHVQAGQLRKNALRHVASVARETKGQRIITGLPQEQIVRSLQSTGETALAKKELLELIERTAKNRNFIQADQLREWLIEIDSAAYAEIIQAAEIIDAEKVSAIDKGHIEIWSGLYDVLSTEEFSSIYHSLIHRRFNDGEQIITQGDVQSSLYFINSGRVRIFYATSSGEIQFKIMTQGEVLGADTFFEPTVWTVSAASVGRSDLSILKLDRLNKWCAEYPGLESRLREFCNRFENIGTLIKADEKERRSDTRYSVQGELNCSIIDDREQKIGINTRGDISDISEGGISWVCRIPKKESSRLLLGRKVKIDLPMEDLPGKYVSLYGEVMAVKSTWAVESEFSIHVKFDERLPLQQLQSVITAFRKESIFLENK